MMLRRMVTAALAGLATTYALTVRPRLLRWGATGEELREPFPDASLIPGGTRSATMAITIDAPPERVWPWLAQMGTNRGGWYSWDRLDNWGRTSADRVHPEWQAIELGDCFASTPDGTQAWIVAALEPERFLALRTSIDLRGKPFDPAGPAPRFSTDSTWSFLLKPLPENRTRLVVSGYWAFHPRWLQPLMSVLFLDIEHWIMQTRQFANLKRLAEHPDANAPVVGPQAEPVLAGEGTSGAETAQASAVAATPEQQERT